MTEDTDTRLVVILLVVFGVLFVFPALGMGAGMIGFGMDSGMWGGGVWGGTVPGWMFLVGILFQVLFLAAVLGGAYLLYRALTDSGEASDEAIEELRRAYARGDLSDEEFERRRERLQRDT